MCHFCSLAVLYCFLKVRVSFCVITVIQPTLPEVPFLPHGFQRRDYTPERVFDNQIARREYPKGRRLVWPDQLRYGDRIRHQMVYVPNNYAYEKTPIKRILLYNGINPEWEVPRLDRGEFIGCPVRQCTLTIDRSVGSEVDALLFRHTYTRPSFKRPPNQIWIMYHTEAPYSTSYMTDGDAFNWTANYRWDSDVPNPYGYFVEHNPPLVSSEPENHAANKSKMVAWFVSNCWANNNRMAYARQLAKHISVDIYGRCGSLQCPRSNHTECVRMLKTDYKFYLAFENANCRYYVTEKLFYTGLGNDVLPIVMGPSRRDYEMVAPRHSFIHVDDFESPELLAAYLRKLDRDDALYNEYFQWKRTGEIMADTMFYCRLCAMLHDTERAPKHYGNINEWWSGKNVCRDPTRRY